MLWQPQFAGVEPAIVLPNPTGRFSNLNFCLIILSHFHQTEQQIWAISFLLCVEDDLEMNTIERLLGACRRHGYAFQA